MRIGELFILGFFGKVVPDWLKQFAARYGLGGVILFDYSCRTQQYDNNIESPEQVQRLCKEIAALPSAPDGVHRSGGWPGAAAEGEPRLCAVAERKGIQSSGAGSKSARSSPRALPRCGGSASTMISRLSSTSITTPTIRTSERSSAPTLPTLREVEANALLASEAARAQRIGLCLKHFPGIGGALVDSHQEFMDISDALRPEQEELFYSLAPKMFGDAVLVSHAIVRQWDRDRPMTLSAAGLGRLRQRLPDTLLITDDMQMQGLQKALGTREASLQSLEGGHGHALHRQQSVRSGTGNGRNRPNTSAKRLRDGTLSGSAIEQSIARVGKRKALLMA